MKVLSITGFSILLPGQVYKKREVVDGGAYVLTLKNYLSPTAREVTDFSLARAKEVAQKMRDRAVFNGREDYEGAMRKLIEIALTEKGIEELARGEEVIKPKKLCEIFEKNIPGMPCRSESSWCAGWNSFSWGFKNGYG